MRYALILIAMILAGCDSHPAKATSNYRALSYQDLKSWKPSCKNKESEQNLLIKNYQTLRIPADPDELDEETRAFNFLLKDLIWWYDYSCGVQE